MRCAYCALRGFDYEQGKFDLFELMDVQERAASIRGRKADMMTLNSTYIRQS